MNRYLRELAEAMDDRVRRLGEHTAADAAAVGTAGPRPVCRTTRSARAGWEQRASLVAAYRERYGYAHPADPIGPEPAKTSPEARAAWHAALERPRPDRRHRPARLQRRRPVAAARHLRTRDRLGTPARRRGTAAHAPGRTRCPRQRQSAPNTKPAPHAAAERTVRHRRLAADLAGAGSQGRPGSGAVRRRPGNPAPMGDSHRDHPPHRDRRRHRTAPPPPRPAAGTTAPPPRRSGTPDTLSPDPADRAERHLGSAHPRPESSPCAPCRPPAAKRGRFGQAPGRQRPARAGAHPSRPPSTRSPNRCCGSATTPKPPRPNSTTWQPRHHPAQRKTAPAAWRRAAQTATLLQPPQPDVVPSARVLQHHRAAKAGTGRGRTGTRMTNDRRHGLT